MRITIVVPLHTQSEKADSIPLGALCLAARLRAHHDVHVVDMNTLVASPEKVGVDSVVKRTLDLVRENSPDVVGLQCLCNSFHITARLAKLVKASLPNSHVVLGGPHTTLLEEDILQVFPFVDAVLTGEADDILPQYLESDDLPQRGTPIPGVFSRSLPHPTTQRAPSPPSLEELPIPAYEMLDPSLYEQLNPLREDLLISIDAGRGCPFKCSFCATREVWSTPRQKSAGRLLQEMSLLHQLFHKNKFRLVHDSFLFRRSVVAQLLDVFITENQRFEWGCSVKPDLLDKTLIDKFVDAGCRGVFLGIESASPTVQRRIGKVLDLQKVANNVQYAISCGLGLITSFVIGFPFETAEDLQLTLDCHKRMVDMGVLRSMVNVLCPLPASRLRREGFPIIYNGCPPNLSDPAWMLDDDSELLVRRYPQLFSSFYRYELKHISHDDVSAAFYIANQYAALAREEHVVSRRSPSEREQTD